MEVFFTEIAVSPRKPVSEYTERRTALSTTWPRLKFAYSLSPTTPDAD